MNLESQSQQKMNAIKNFKNVPLTRDIFVLLYKVGSFI